MRSRTATTTSDAPRDVQVYATIPRVSRVRVVKLVKSAAWRQKPNAPVTVAGFVRAAVLEKLEREEAAAGGKTSAGSSPPET